MKKFTKNVFILTSAAVLLLCGCSKDKEEDGTETSETGKGAALSAAETTVPEETSPKISFSEKPEYRLHENHVNAQTGALAANVIANPDENDENIYFRSADGSEEPSVLNIGDTFLGWKVDSILEYDQNGAFQARFSREPEAFEGRIIIRMNAVRNEMEAAFIPTYLSQFPKADNDGRTLWFAADNFEETLEMLGYSADAPYIGEATYSVMLTTDRININNLPLEDVRNLINVISIEVK